MTLVSPTAILTLLRPILPLLRLCKITTFVCRSCDVGFSTSSGFAFPLLSKEDPRRRQCGSAQWLLRFEDLGGENILC
jgi:hypothetical protein